MAMLTRVFMALLLLCGIHTGAWATTDVATNATYTVQAGDWLAKIARKFGTTWQTIAKENAVANPDRIYPGMRLTIPKAVTPETSASRVDHSAHDEFAWKNPAHDPCVACGAWTSIQRLEYPSDVARELLVLVASEAYEMVEIRAGDRFDAMLSGKGVLNTRVRAAWLDGHSELARRYAVEKDGMTYALYFPLVCGNWAKHVAASPPKKDPPEPNDLVERPAPEESTPDTKEIIAPMPKTECRCPDFVPIAIFEPLQGSAVPTTNQREGSKE